MRFIHALPATFAAVVLVACAGTPSAAPPAVNGSAPVPDALAPDAAGAPPAEGTLVAKTAELDPNETICRRRVVTGSRFPETRCTTRAMWAAEEEEARKATEKLQGSRAVDQK